MDPGIDRLSSAEFTERANRADSVEAIQQSLSEFARNEGIPLDEADSNFRRKHGIPSG